VILSKPINDAEIEAAVQAELPWLLERRQAGERAAAEDTVSGRLRRAVKAMRQPYEKVCQASGIPFQQLADFMAGGQLASDALDRLAAAALPARAWRSFAKTGVRPDQCP